MGRPSPFLSIDSMVARASSFWKPMVSITRVGRGRYSFSPTVIADNRWLLGFASVASSTFPRESNVRDTLSIRWATGLCCRLGVPRRVGTVLRPIRLPPRCVIYGSGSMCALSVFWPWVPWQSSRDDLSSSPVTSMWRLTALP